MTPSAAAKQGGGSQQRAGMLAVIKKFVAKIDLKKERKHL